MSHPLAQLYTDFHDAILTQEPARAATAIKPHPRLTPEQQLAIYADGYRIRLLTAIRADYPALLALLGDAAFDAIARDYIAAHPPAHFNLDRYPHGFAAFFLTRSQNNVANDLARIECAIAQVFMLPDSAPLDATHLVPESFGEHILSPRIACQLLVFDYDVNAYLTAQRPAIALPEPGPTHLCLVRHENEVKRHHLTAASYRLLGHLFAGQPIATAIESAIADNPADEQEIATHLQPWFAEWLQNGFFCETGI